MRYAYGTVERIMKKNNKTGFVSAVAMLLLALFSAFGVIYWFTSKSSAEMIVFEADRIKARNFALAGVEKAKIFMMNEYRAGNLKPEFKKGETLDSDAKFFREEFKVKFEDGEYEIISIKPLVVGNDVWFDRPHFSGKRVIGKYDLWEIKTTGKVFRNKIKAEQSVLMKVYRDDLVYY